MTYTLRLAAIFSAGKFIAFARGELARRLREIVAKYRLKVKVINVCGVDLAS